MWGWWQTGVSLHQYDLRCSNSGFMHLGGDSHNSLRACCVFCYISIFMSLWITYKWKKKSNSQKTYVQNTGNCEVGKRKTCPYIFSSSGLGRRRILGVAVTAAIDKIRKSVVNISYVYTSNHKADRYGKRLIDIMKNLPFDESNVSPRN